MAKLEFVELNEESIDELLSNSRQHGVYKGILDQFKDADVKGTNVMTLDQFKGKKLPTIAAGFRNALKVDSENGNKYEGIICTNNEKGVYLVWKKA